MTVEASLICTRDGWELVPYDTARPSRTDRLWASELLSVGTPKSMVAYLTGIPESDLSPHPVPKESSVPETERVEKLRAVVNGGYLRIYGGSDDLCELEGVIDDEIDLAGGSDRAIIVIESDGAGCEVQLQFGRGGWAYTLTPQLDPNDDPYPFPELSGWAGQLERGEVGLQFELPNGFDNHVTVYTESAE